MDSGWLHQSSFFKIFYYDKDRIDPVGPHDIPKDFFADMDLSAFPLSAKFLCYDLVRNGLPPSTDLISVYSDEE